MSDAWDAVCLSPHLDDAALSCGGQIAARTRSGERVLVLTLFTADEPPPPHSELIDRLHALFDLEGGVVAHRRREDEEACRRLGAAVRHADLPEAGYRRDADGNYLYRALPDLFGAPASPDHAFVEALRDVVEPLPRGAEILVPLGVGGHVDHRLTRAAAELTDRDLVYYEEMPYVEKWLALRRTLGRRADWEPTIVPLEDADVDAKVAACQAYTSQVRGLYDSAERMEAAIRRRARKLGGERVWRRT